MFKLSIFLKDRLVGRSSFSAEEVRIGRSSDNEVRIDNPALSRYHASIESVAGIHLIKDFGSQNGTFVNGERVVGRAGLNDGDRITVGKFTLVFATQQRAQVTAPEVTDHASYAVAGKTVVMKTPLIERPCPWVGYLEERSAEAYPFPRHAIDRNLYVLGTGKECQLQLSLAKKLDRAALIVRSWGGFALVTLSPGVKHNGKAVDLSVELSDGDSLEIGENKFTFHAGHPNA